MDKRKSPEFKARMSEARRQWWANLTPEELEKYKFTQRKPHPKTSEALKGKRRGPGVKTGKTVACSECGEPTYKQAYELARTDTLFCSRDCFFKWRQKHWAETKNFETCLSCGKQFPRPKGRSKHNNGNHYCSKECAGKGKSGENSPNWAGGRQLRTDGYVDVSASLAPAEYASMKRIDGRIFEHRLVMAIHLGRPLADYEVVHHKNGDKADNRIENLELFHAREHDGVTASEQKEIRRLKKELADMQKKLEKLEGKS